MVELLRFSLGGQSPPNASLVFAKNTGLGAMVPITKNTQALVGIRSNEAKERRGMTERAPGRLSYRVNLFRAARGNSFRTASAPLPTSVG